MSWGNRAGLERLSRLLLDTGDPELLLLSHAKRVRFRSRFAASRLSANFSEASFDMASMLSGMGDSMKEAAKQKIEEELAAKAPATMKPLFPCCGGPVGTMDKCICMVPADQQDNVKEAIKKYKDM